MYKRFIFAIGLFLISSSAQATTVKPVNLEQLVGRAETIFRGTLAESVAEYDTEESHSMVRYYTFTIEECIKGDCGESFTFKQLADGTFVNEDGIAIRQRMFFPTYEVGKTYVLFLPMAHPKTGLMAPIALFQGVFPIKVVNGQETVPDLKARSHFLKTGLSTSNAKFLQKSLGAVNEDHSYNTFKGLIKKTME
ncbi:MAG: hypothetical protein H7A33_04270 [Deltaproteobacteria bacterium]|nr:hypothetical protein [Deltaproteobacteria bacterium]